MADEIKRYTDSTGEAWALSLTVATIERIEQKTGLSMYSGLGSGPLKFIVDLCSSVGALARVGYWMLSEADRQRITIDAWAERIASETVVESLREAVLDAIVRFFRGSTTGRVIELNLSLARKAEAKAAADLADPALEKTLEDRVLSMLNGSSGSSPGSPALTLDLSRSDSSSGCRSVDAAPTGNPSPT